MTAQAPQAVPIAVPELDLVLTRFRLRARVRALWIETLREQGLVAAELLDRDAPGEMEAWLPSDESACALVRDAESVERQLSGDVDGRFARLASIFGLSNAERDLLEACAALALDPGLREICSWLTGQPGLTGRLVARLFGNHRAPQWGCDSALFAWEMVNQHDDVFTLDPAIRDWLAGVQTMDELLAGRAAIHRPLPPLAGWPLQTVAAKVSEHVSGKTTRPVRVLLMGAAGSGRRTFAAAVSAALGFPLLSIDAAEVDNELWRRLYMRAQRSAFLNGYALAWRGETVAKRAWPGGVTPFPLQFVVCETARDTQRQPGLVEYTVELPALAMLERARVWRQCAPPAWDGAEVDEVAKRYRVPVGDIVAVCAASPATPAEAGLRVREASRDRLGELAQLLPCSFTWDDLVLPAHVLDTLRDLVFEAKNRLSFWEQPAAQRLFPLGRGLIALFSGSSGTGKTMAAQVIAASLGYDLFRIDLSSVVSKYVGETSQNIDRVLRRAADMDAVLFFDEADAMFARRTTEIREAQDKFANTDAAHLLQAIESYPGVALLATNQKTSVDQAFLRRIRYMIEFPKPEAAQRLEIWSRVLGELAGKPEAERLHDDLAAMARDLDTTGAQIKNAVLGALFISRRMTEELSAEHLLRGLERELAKEGRTLSAKERGRIRRS